ncbi:MAG TPA: cell division protein ZapA [Longimicrobium sp.]|nr:cell division protein ZapA [Longimicrobium sp.]
MSRPPRRPAPPRHTVAVEIAGEKHVLRSDVPPEYTRAVAAHVDATIRALPGFQTLEPFRAATLAALSITDELFRAREEIRRLREDAEYRTNILADQLEAAAAAAAEKRPVRRPGAASGSASWMAETGADAASETGTSPLPSGAPAAAAPVSQPAATPAPPPTSAAATVQPVVPTAPPPPRTDSGAARPEAELPPELRPPPLPAGQPAWQEDASAVEQRPRRGDEDPELELPPPE